MDNHNRLRRDVARGGGSHQRPGLAAREQWREWADLNIEMIDHGLDEHDSETVSTKQQIDATQGADPR
jgi:hypothetical protein